MRDVRWIEMRKLFEAKEEDVKLFKFYHPLEVGFLPVFLRNQAREHFEYGEYYCVEIGMENVLWVLTLALFVYILTTIQADHSHPTPSFNYLLNKYTHHRLVFHNNYSLANIINYFANRTYRTQRTHQFKYSRPSISSN